MVNSDNLCQQLSSGFSFSGTVFAAAPDAANCTAGTLTPEFKSFLLARTNLFRVLHGLEPLVLNETAATMRKARR